MEQKDNDNWISYRYLLFSDVWREIEVMANFIDEKYFKVVDNDIIFTGPYMEAYLPSYFFSKGLAQEVGDSIKTIGIFNVKTFNDKECKNPNPLRMVNIPIEIMTYPTSYEPVQMDLHHTGEPEIFVLMKYYENDVFCPRAVPKTVKAFENFLEILTYGKIPASVSYDDIFDIWAKNREVANVNFDVADNIYELVISEIYRSRKNPFERFGAVLGKDPNHSPYDYRAASPREITKLNSSFTGLIFENIDEMLSASVIRSKKGTPENISPMEKIMKY